MSVIEITVPATAEMRVDDSRAAMSELISDRLGISREAFLARLDAGEYEGVDDGVILHLVTLAPFAR
jgi:hypothetical protein